MKVSPTSLPEVLLIAPDVHGDDRGFFFELWHQERYSDFGIPKEFRQDNLSFSKRGTLRGLHFKNPHAQGKLVSVLEGEVFDVAVDVRQGSPTFTRWVGHRLSSSNKHQLYVPEGFAHGFLVLSDTALFHYKCTGPYVPASERSILWNDPAIGIEWPLKEPILSAKDGKAPRLSEIDERHLVFAEG